jgi:hypothetical protein
MKNPHAKSKTRREHEKKFYRQNTPIKDSITKQGFNPKSSDIEENKNILLFKSCK